MRSAVVSLPVRKYDGDSISDAQDYAAVEEPMQIRVNRRDVAITMRTPGNDRELAVGFLVGEAILRDRGEVADVTEDGRGTVTVRLAGKMKLPLARLQRQTYMSSSCGVCGKQSMESLKEIECELGPMGGTVRLEFKPGVIEEMPAKLLKAQAAFNRTGGLHGAGLFDFEGNLIAVREDVGRHNAVDKLIGAEFLAGRLPLRERVLMLSGRVSFELIQKALVAGIPAVIAVGAPSSLAVETARRFGVTLIGFLRGNHFNVYAGQIG